MACDESCNLFLDHDPPFAYLSAKFTGTYAYETVKDRMPIIVTKVIDFLCQNKTNLEEEFGKDSTHDLKQIIGKLSKLKTEMQTNKPLKSFEGSCIDYHKWNNFLASQTGVLPRWFDSPWLLVECYMYRFVHSAFEESQYFRELDPFSHLKMQAFDSQKDSICSLLHYTNEINTATNLSLVELEPYFSTLLEVALWGNRNDLSVSAGNSQAKIFHSIVNDTQLIRKNILVNHTKDLWLYLQQLYENEERGELTIIADNCGLELLGDLCLLSFLLSRRFFSRVTLSVKKMPWFVSDVTRKDFFWTLKHMTSNEELGSPVFKKFAERVNFYLSNQQLQVTEENYWTLPLPYNVMKQEDSALYSKLSQSKLLLFKGDLNYRKLGADISWPPTTPFKTFLQGFHPAPLVVLRTIKAEIVCDLDTGLAESIESQDKSWMAKGDYGLIQFSREDISM